MIFENSETTAVVDGFFASSEGTWSREILECDFAQFDTYCVQLKNRAQNYAWKGALDQYDVEEVCKVSSSIPRSNPSSCVNKKALENYLNSKLVRETLGLQNFTDTWIRYRE